MNEKFEKLNESTNTHYREFSSFIHETQSS